jgi:hypothetical protein
VQGPDAGTCLPEITQAEWDKPIMPTVCWIDGLRVVVYPNDHRPAHVHVIGRGNEATFRLHCPQGPPELHENFGFSRTELVRIAAGLAIDLEKCCDCWQEIHGAV